LFRYWPVILIAIGAGKLIDFFIDSHQISKANVPIDGREGGAAASPPAPLLRSSHTGEVLAIVILIVLVLVAVSHKSVRLEWQASSQSVAAQGAQSADVNISIPAGDLTLRGGASAGKILEADFRYTSEDGVPRVDYSVSQGRGTLDLTQQNASHVHWTTRHNDWSLRLNNDIPMNIKIDIGAGHGDLDLHGMTLTGLSLEMGAGQVNADLAANWKTDSMVSIEGGVGQATLRLPETIGVSVHASGGIGAISTGSLHKQGDAYVNDAYGKSPVTLEVNVEGGVGQINLVSEP
jgi:hypothetical protein